MMKKLITLLLSLTLVFTIVACGGNNVTSVPTPEPEPVDPTANFGEFRWPRSDLASLIPVPKSTYGEIGWEQSYGFVIYVGKTSKSDYVEYVDECWDRGFTFEYRRGDDFFWADNIDGHKVTVRYDDEFSIMFIRMDAADEDESESIPEPIPDTQSNDGDDDDVNVDDIDEPIVSNVDWKEFLRLYEEWIDNYIELLEKYNEDPTDITILNDYLKMMVELAEWAEMAEQVEVDLENDPDALKDYLETLSRIILKLSEVEF